MTNEAQLALINSIPAILAAIFSGIAVIFGLINRNQIAKTDSKVESVAVMANDAAATGTATHLLVNSQRSEILLILATDKRRIADLTKAPADITAADVARKTYEDHVLQQKVIDSKAGPTPSLSPAAAAAAAIETVLVVKAPSEAK